jgi:lipid A ethanolaminephosphotransferase
MTHTKFIVAFPTLLYVVCNAFHAAKLARWFEGKEGLDMLPFAAYLVAGLCLFIAVFALLAHRWTIKPVAIALTVASAAATYFMAKYDVVVDSSMVLNTLHTDATEVRQLVSWSMLPYGFLLIALPLLLILRCRITFAARGRYLLASAAVFGVAMLVAVGALYANFTGIHRAANVSGKYVVYTLVPVNLISGTISAASKSLRERFPRDAGGPELTARVTKPGDLVVVLAIGESSRRKSFGVYGYRRDTTPRLAGIAGLHLLAGNATRGSTIYALRQILEKNGVKLPALVSRAGVRTSCLVNYTLYENCAGVGEIAVSRCGHGGKCFDEDVVTLLDRELAGYESGYRFVVMHLGGGSHGPLYASRHPPEFVRFRPTCDDADVTNRCSTGELHNSYDNTILYADHVIAETIGSLERARVPYVFIYLSDHGESLMEGGRLFHGMPPGVSLPEEQADIPLIVKSSVPIGIDARDVYRQPDVFDSVLALFAIQSPGFDRSGAFMALSEPSRSLARGTERQR